MIFFSITIVYKGNDLGCSQVMIKKSHPDAQTETKVFFILASVYFTLFQPNFDYVCSSWFPNLSQKSKMKIKQHNENIMTKQTGCQLKK